MNKTPYFVRYMPIAAKIEIGSLVSLYGKYDDGSIAKVLAMKNLFARIKKEVNEYVDDVLIQTLQPVKLFLCSRDIKSGDVVYHKFSDGEISEQYEMLVGQHEERIWLHKDGYPSHTVHVDNVFKVIGEVSTGAKWIKSGDQFGKQPAGFYAGDFQLLPIYKGDAMVTKLGSRKQLNAVMDNEPVDRYIALFKCQCCETFK